MLRDYYSQLPVNSEALIILVLFLSFFTGVIIFSFSRKSKDNAKKISQLPLED